MRRFFFLILLFLILFFSGASSALAVTDPFARANNRFGIHIIDENDLGDAAHLVNSAGGDWGYVTLVIRADERNQSRWQKVMDEMRRKHLIPIVRIAGKFENGNWQKLAKEDIDDWVDFLNSLNWVVKNRYVVVGNEPNHAAEWGGVINPAEYAQILKEFSLRLKFVSLDFFVLPAGMDASAPDGRKTMSEANFLRGMLKAEPEVLSYVDGWTSHSYPNPGFVGSSDGYGRGTVRTFLWELDFLRELGVSRELPVFITETGWLNTAPGLTERYRQAYGGAWSDKRIVAVTPFILNYQAEPFSAFSWKASNGTFYDFYEMVRNLPKTKGEPEQIARGSVNFVLSYPFVERNSVFYGIALVKNEGQSIWDKREYRLVSNNIEVLDYDLPAVEPGHTARIVFKAKAPGSTGSYREYLGLYKGQELVTSLYEMELRVFEKPQIRSLFELIGEKIGLF